jgi:hypothetical protein
MTDTLMLCSIAAVEIAEIRLGEPLLRLADVAVAAGIERTKVPLYAAPGAGELLTLADAEALMLCGPWAQEIERRQGVHGWGAGLGSWDVPDV